MWDLGSGSSKDDRPASAPLHPAAGSVEGFMEAVSIRLLQNSKDMWRVQ